MKVVLFDSAENIPEEKKFFYKSYIDTLVNILHSASIDELSEWGYSKDDDSDLPNWNQNDDTSDNSTFELYKRITINICNDNDVKIYSSLDKINYYPLKYFFNTSKSERPSFEESKRPAGTSMLLNYTGGTGKMDWYTDTPDIFPSEVTLVNIKMVNWFPYDIDNFDEFIFLSSILNEENYKDQCVKLTNPLCLCDINKIVIYQNAGENDFICKGEKNGNFFKRRGVVVVIRQDEHIDIGDGHKIENKSYKKQVDSIAKQAEMQLINSYILTDRNNFHLTKLQWEYRYMREVHLSGYLETGYCAHIYISDSREIINSTK